MSTLLEIAHCHELLHELHLFPSSGAGEESFTLSCALYNNAGSVV
jgi:hypothetical protein